MLQLLLDDAGLEFRYVFELPTRFQVTTTHYLVPVLCALIRREHPFLHPR